LSDKTTTAGRSTSSDVRGCNLGEVRSGVKRLADLLMEAEMSGDLIYLGIVAAVGRGISVGVA
jgi:hypothetical protein